MEGTERRGDAPKSTILVSSSLSVKPFSAAVNRGTEAHTEPGNQSARSFVEWGLNRVVESGQPQDEKRRGEARVQGGSQRIALGTESVVILICAGV
jgi:hypothetical protein